MPKHMKHHGAMVERRTPIVCATAADMPTQLARMVAALSPPKRYAMSREHAAPKPVTLRKFSWEAGNGRVQ